MNKHSSTPSPGRGSGSGSRYPREGGSVPSQSLDSFTTMLAQLAAGSLAGRQQAQADNAAAQQQQSENQRARQQTDLAQKQFAATQQYHADTLQQAKDRLTAEE